MSAMTERVPVSNGSQTSFNRAFRLHESGRIAEAIAAYRSILRMTSRDADVLHHLGIALCQSGLAEEGIRSIREALRIAPGLVVAQNNLGHALLRLGKFEEAVSVFRSLVARQPQYEKAIQGLRQSLNGLSRSAEAAEVLRALIAKFPKSAMLRNELGIAYLALDRKGEAAGAFAEALDIDANFIAAAVNLATAFTELRRYDEAAAVLENVFKIEPDSLPARAQLIAMFRHQLKSEKALELARKTLAVYPEDPKLRLVIAECLIDLGHNSDAEKVLRESVRLEKSVVGAINALAQIHKFKASDPEIHLVNKLLHSAGLDESERKQLLFTRAKIEDDINHPGEAIAAANAAKTIRPLPDKMAEHLVHVQKLMEAMDSRFFADRRILGNASEQPVFVIGMPRSGTTLTEQIIASHAMADGAGELNALPDLRRSLGPDDDAEALLMRVLSLDASEIAKLAESYLAVLRKDRKQGTIRITDKLPHNFQNIWLIALLFPNARIIHCNRHPVDVCISIFLRNFTTGHWYTRDLATMGKFYNLYKESVDHWKSVCGLKWYENDYESLVADPEPNIRAMIDFLGLPWDEKCLSHTETERTVMTFSKWQVRQPIYRSSVERWRKYAPYIKPLLDELGISAG